MVVARRRSAATAALVAVALLATSPWGAQAVGVAPVPSTTGVGDVPGWTLELTEEFRTIDPARWAVKDDTYSSNEDSYLRAANCSIDDAGADGHALRAQGREETVRRWGRTFSYTSCSVTTEGRYSVPGYFRAEVRAKVPMEQGMWAAPLWFRPADGSGGEIDLVETLGGQPSRPRITQTIHTDYGDDHDQSSYSYPFEKLGDPVGTGWHTYTIEKVPGRMTMWVDDVQTAQWSTGDPQWYSRFYDSGKRWELRINLQIGGSWGGPPDASTDWSPARTAMLVDRVRVWTPTVLSELPSAPLGGTEGHRSAGAPDDPGAVPVEGDAEHGAGDGRSADWLSTALAFLTIDLATSRTPGREAGT